MSKRVQVALLISGNELMIGDTVVSNPRAPPWGVAS